MVIWITGCTAGLGKALVKEWIEAGHVVVGGGRNQKVLDELSDTYGSRGGYFFQVNVADDVSVKQFCTKAKAASGTPDYLINNAGMMNQRQPLWEVSAEEFDQLTSININGVANMIRHTVPFMIDVDRGVVINLSSGLGTSTMPYVASYCASKFAVEGLSRSLAQEFEEISPALGCIAMSPGVIHTDMLEIAFGDSASAYHTADVWAKKAAKYILNLTAAHNGQSLRIPD